MVRKQRIISKLFPIVTAFLVFAMIPCSLCIKVSANNLEDVYADQAADITQNCIFVLSENQVDLAKLLDSSVSTNWVTSQDTSIEIASLQRIGAVYIEWTASPGPWTLSVFNKNSFKPYKESGINEFFNEFISIDESYTKIRISWKKIDKPVSIGRITIFSKGTVPGNIQQWNPPCEKADMLVIPTHADDEHLYLGGTLSTYAGDQHKNVQVAYMINHGYFRTREVLAGLWAVGVTNYPMISDFPDKYVDTYEKAVKTYGFENFIEYQVMLLRRFKPDVVVGHDLMGEYGHGAHILNARALVQAIDAAKDPAQFPQSATEYGTWEIKKCYLHLYKENPIVMDWTLPLSNFNGKSSWEMAQTGYQQHVSQHQFKFRVRIEGPNDCRQFGLYYTSVGEDINKNDFFENIPESQISGNSSSISSSDSFKPDISSAGYTSNAGNSSKLDNASNSNNPDTKKKTIGISSLTAIFLILSIHLINKRRRRLSKNKDIPIQ